MYFFSKDKMFNNILLKKIYIKYIGKIKIKIKIINNYNK